MLIIITGKRFGKSLLSTILAKKNFKVENPFLVRKNMIEVNKKC